MLVPQCCFWASGLSRVQSCSLGWEWGIRGCWEKPWPPLQMPGEYPACWGSPPSSTALGTRILPLYSFVCQERTPPDWRRAPGPHCQGDSWCGPGDREGALAIFGASVEVLAPVLQTPGTGTFWDTGPGAPPIPTADFPSPSQEETQCKGWSTQEPVRASSEAKGGIGGVER